MARIEIMSGTERRRRWSDEAKLRILAEADEPGARIGDVARRHDIHPGQIRLWRQSFSYADRPTVFLPVEITEEVGVIPTLIDQNSLAHFLRPIDMIFHG
ncbi:transposase [Neorhizobium galegae]|uniref:transposase n=1 Tax=Neorhizobium galegae TaxID=399 RepID=UPI0009BC2595|nr:transposase [Neorhizobium galegae]